MDAELLTQSKEKVPHPHNLPERGSEDKPVIQIPQDPEAAMMHDRGDWGHGTSERLRSCGKAEAKGTKRKN